jgi:biotin carboxyl carrier protein
VTLDFRQISELLTLLVQADVKEFTLKTADIELTVRKSETKSSPKDKIATPTPNSNCVEIKAPMAGKFYRYPDPNEPYVRLGDSVRKGQTIGEIDLMYEIEADVSGRIIEIMVDDGEFVPYGHPLMLIDPIYNPPA